MKKFLQLVAVSCIFSVFWLSCAKEEPKEPEFDFWARFDGTYKVTGPGDSTYIMTVERFDSSNGKWFRIKNVINRIPEVSQYDGRQLAGDYAKDKLDFGIGPPCPIKDYYGNRWCIRGEPNDTLGRPKSMLINDTILFFLRVTNLTFYHLDGVPYYFEYELHTAVKTE